MTRNKLDKILLQAELYYGVFPVERETVNHGIIKRTVSLIKRITEYKGHTKGFNALPKELLEMRYNEFYNTLQELREQLDREQIAYREAKRAIDDAEELLDHIFI